MEDKKLYIFVGYKYTFINERVKKYAIYETVELNSDIEVVDLYEMSLFEYSRDVIKLDNEVFDKVCSLRDKGDTFIEIGLSKSLVSSIRAYKDYLVNEFEFKRPDVKKYILKEYNEGGR